MTRFALFFSLIALALASCGRPKPVVPAPARHEHVAPHGGVAIALGAEAYHLELVLDPVPGTLKVYVLDGHLEKFIRIEAPSIDIAAAIDGVPRTLRCAAVADPATGESVGDTALFEGKADWLRTTSHFDAVLQTITIRRSTFTNVKFNYPRGNEVP